MTSREEFEAHIKDTAWYRVLSEGAKDDDEAASIFRMARMAASEAWQAAERQALERAAERIQPRNDPSDWTDYAKVRAEAAAEIRALMHEASRVASKEENNG